MPKAKRPRKDASSSIDKQRGSEGKKKSGSTVAPQTFADQAAWERWLQANHAIAIDGIWLQMAKGASGIPSVTHPEALESALCYGWIDGQALRLDEKYTLRRFVPRRKNSIWSQINRAKSLELIKQGCMQPAGIAAIEQAKANGRWDAAYQPPSDKTLPADLEEALKKSPKAAAFFKTLNGQNRYAILFRLQTAKKAETRTKRLATFVEMLERGKTLH